MTTRSRLAVLPLLALTATGCPEDPDRMIEARGPMEVEVGVPFEVEVEIGGDGQWVVLRANPGPHLQLAEVERTGGGPLEYREENQIYEFAEYRASGRGPETIAWTVECTAPGSTSLRFRAHWYANRPEMLPTWNLPGPTYADDTIDIECVAAGNDTDDPTDPTGDPTGDPTDDPTDPTGDPTDDPTDPTDDPTGDPPTEAPLFDVYLALDDATIQSYIFSIVGLERSDAAPVSVDISGYRAAASPTGDTLFISTDTEIQSIVRDPTTGDLTPVPTLATYDGSIATLHVAADGNTLLATDLFVDTPAITKWGINPDRSLSESASFLPSDFAGGIVTNAAADTLYVPLDVAPGAIEVFDFFGIDAVPSLRDTIEISEAGRGPAVAGDCLFVSSGGSVHGFPLAADGTPGTPVVSETSGGDVHAIGEQSRVLLDGAFVPDGELAIYDFDDACALSPAGSTPRESWTVVSDPVPVGEQAYLVEADDSGDLWVLTVDASGEITRGELVELPYVPLQLFALRRE